MKSMRTKTSLSRLLALGGLAAILSSPAIVAAQSVAHVTGGGTASFGADLDGDGEIDGSQFGFMVDIKGDGSAEGHLLFAMAGKFDFLRNMFSIQGPVTEGKVNPDGSVTLRGCGPMNQIGVTAIYIESCGVRFEVAVKEGHRGHELGTIQFTAIDLFAGAPGDTDLTNNSYDQPTQTIRSGLIRIRK
jgi:hypothetical protein